MARTAIVEVKKEDEGCYDFHPGVELDLSRLIDEAETFVNKMTGYEEMPLSEHDVMVVLLRWIGSELVDANQRDGGYDDETWKLFEQVFESVEKLPLRRYIRQVKASQHTAEAVVA